MQFHSLSAARVAATLFVSFLLFGGCSGAGDDVALEEPGTSALERYEQGLTADGDITEYAGKCRAALGRITVSTFNCLSGSLIPITNTPDGLTCDKPTWLSLGGSYCVNNARLLKLPTSDADTEVRVICRRYKAGPPTDEKFQDVAIVMANKKTGDTCYFQALAEGGVDLSGKNVPNPLADPTSTDAAERAAAAAAKAFYFSPKRLREDKHLQCAKCHDSDPFMHSPYIDQVVGADALPTGFKRAPYRLVEEAYFTSGPSPWPKPRAVTTAKVKDGNGDINSQVCTSCHRIGMADTCEYWAPKSVNRMGIDGRNGAASMWPTSHWMPEGLPATEAEFKTLYDKHIDALECCCKTPWKLGCTTLTDLGDLKQKKEGTGKADWTRGGEKCVDGATGAVALGVSISPYVIAARGSSDSSCTAPLDTPVCADFQIERTDVNGSVTTITRGPNNNPLRACGSHPSSPYPGPHDAYTNVEPGDLVTISAPQQYAFGDGHGLWEFSGWQVSESCPCSGGSSSTCQFRTKGSRDWFGMNLDSPGTAFDGDPSSFHCQAQYRWVDSCQMPDAGTDAGTWDAGYDAGTDAGYDAGTDAGYDAGTDAGYDAGVDGGADAGRDGGFDGGYDAGVDGGTDAGVDGGFDAGVDGGFDAGVDGGYDAGFDGGADAGRDGGSDAGTCDGGPCPADAGVATCDGGVVMQSMTPDGRLLVRCQSTTVPTLP